MKDLCTLALPGATRRAPIYRVLCVLLGAAVALGATEPTWATEATTVTAPEAEQQAATPEKQPELAPEEKEFREKMQAVGVAFSQRRFEEALEKLQEAEKLRPGSDDVLGARAGILAETGKYDEALAIYDKMVEEHPKAFVPRFNQAEVFCMQKKYDEARTRFEALLKDFPDSDFLCFKMMLIAMAEGDNAQAVEWGRRLQRPTPTPVMYYAAAALSISGGEIMKGKALMLAAEKDFGAGQHSLLYQSLAAMGLVLQGDYPPTPPQVSNTTAK